MMIEHGMFRDRKLLDLAHYAPCMFRIPGVCRSGVNPSVPCHSNLQRHGRGKDNKSHDCYAPAGCPECHYWLDFGKASREEKELAFLAAFERWILFIFRHGWVKTTGSRSRALGTDFPLSNTTAGDPTNQAAS
jgi:hypothetical protein